MSDFVVVIPARYASERLPGKPLADIAGKPMIRRVWECATTSSAVEVVIATDDPRVFDACKAFGADVCMTSAKHPSGTDRLAEVSDQRGWSASRIVVNLQGDEPTMPSQLIDDVASLVDLPDTDIGTLASPVANASMLDDPNVVKVVCDDSGLALYFSRAPIPYCRDASDLPLVLSTALHHHGIYAYRVDALRRIVSEPPSAIERCERLEQLRAMSLGLRIRVGIPNEAPGPGIDTPEDLERAQGLFR